jgi:NDP-sugar pyrophosphorylase family protein
MKAMVLVGGLGTRFRPLTFAIPKPLLAVGDKPMLQLIFEQLKRGGCEEIILATGYLAELVEAFCGDGSRFGLRIDYVREPEPLGTAGPLTLIRDRLSKDEFLILMNGDVITRLEFPKMIDFARSRDFDLTVGYVPFIYQSPYGVLTIQGDEISEVREKPEVHYSISSGIYVVKASCLDVIPDNTFFTVPDLIVKLRSKGRKVGAFQIDDFWLGVEDLAHIEKVRAFLDRENHVDASGKR